MRRVQAATLLLLGLTACSSPQTDRLAARDLEMITPNPLIGTVCDSNNPCQGSVLGDGGLKKNRCTVVVVGDLVGVCAPPCGGNVNCETLMPGKSLCTTNNECVLFCGDKGECPGGWTCDSAQTYRVCRPPQQALPGPDMSGQDLAAPDMTTRDLSGPDLAGADLVTKG